MRETWVRGLLVRLRTEDGEGRRHSGPKKAVDGKEERAWGIVGANREDVRGEEDRRGGCG